MRRSEASFVMLAAALAVAACDEKKSTPETTPKADAEPAADKYATADPKLEKALKAAAAPGEADHGPPAEGVFAAGAADQRHPRGAPTKVDLVSDGSEPRISLAASTRLGDGSADAIRSAYGPATMELGMQMGPRTALPNIDLALTLGPAKKDEGGADWLVATIKKAMPAKEQYGQLPSGADKEIGSLEGSQLRMQVTADGRESDLQTQLAKNTLPELERVAQNAAEAWVLEVVPLPEKPVGVGAQWIAETRMPWAGLDVIAYRAYRVKEINGDHVQLTVDVKAYSAETDPTLPGLPKGATLAQFDAEAQGELQLVRGESLVRRAAMQERTVMLLAQGGPPPDPSVRSDPQRAVIPLQIQAQATFARGEEMRASAKP